ncbi:dihydrolipoamide acetyltransferase family protein [Nocardioides baekrokdamisoli]|nr:dihydrolipoamide acetyltransferase family protein [Nocardioides baekrokdamisoli]
MNEFALPDVGEGLTEAELVTWRVDVGDTVAINDIICEIETAKSVVELPTPYAGVVSEILVPVGTTVPVGTALVRIGAVDEVVSVPSTPPADLPNVRTVPSASSERSDDSAQPLTLVGSGPKEIRASRVVLAKPAARLAARERGIELEAVVATRADGVITTDDLTRVAEPPMETFEPIRGVRKAMAEAMVASAAVPHVTIWASTDATRTLELAERVGRRLLTVIARMTVIALQRHPLLNSTFTADGVTLHERVNLGIAAATPRGLIVPNIREADRLDLASLESALDDLVAVARAGRTQPEAQVAGTFTITNIGPFGIEGGTPLLNPGESGILCIGAVAKRPWVVGDAVVPRDVVTVSLTFDHRHIDGEAGSRFLRDIVRMIEEPGTALTF